MYRSAQVILILILLAVFFISATPQLVLAQQSLAISQSVIVKDKNVEDGDIISATNQGDLLSKTPYDPGIVGVISQNPGIVIMLDTDSSFPLMSSGYGFVKVSTSNGPIKTGDLITSSQTPGVGMRATQSGFVIGSAAQDFDCGTPKCQGKIPVNLNLRFAISPKSNDVVLKSLGSILSLSTITALENPSDIFKYVLAGFMVLMSVIIAVITFGKNGALGIEALGRNPRASQTITLGIIINVITSIAILAAGLGAAYFIIVL